MREDTERMRDTRPFVFSNMRSGKGVNEVADFIVRSGGLS
jgi:urease accessory protein